MGTRANCRECRTDLDTCATVVSYKKTATVTARWIEGVPYEESRAVSDAGLFCSDTCLFVFLKFRRADAPEEVATEAE